MSSAFRVKKHREYLKKSGLRPIQVWVPDTRREGFHEEIRRQSILASGSDIEDVELMDFLEKSWIEIDQ